MNRGQASISDTKSVLINPMYCCNGVEKGTIS